MSRTFRNRNYNKFLYDYVLKKSEISGICRVEKVLIPFGSKEWKREYARTRMDKTPMDVPADFRSILERKYRRKSNRETLKATLNLEKDMIVSKNFQNSRWNWF